MEEKTPATLYTLASIMEKKWKRGYVIHYTKKGPLHQAVAVFGGTHMLLFAGKGSSQDKAAARELAIMSLMQATSELFCPAYIFKGKKKTKAMYEEIVEKAAPILQFFDQALRNPDASFLVNMKDRFVALQPSQGKQMQIIKEMLKTYAKSFWMRYAAALMLGKRKAEDEDTAGPSNGEPEAKIPRLSNGVTHANPGEVIVITREEEEEEEGDDDEGEDEYEEQDVAEGDDETEEEAQKPLASDGRPESGGSQRPDFDLETDSDDDSIVCLDDETTEVTLNLSSNTDEPSTSTAPVDAQVVVQLDEPTKDTVDADPGVPSKILPPGESTNAVKSKEAKSTEQQQRINGDRIIPIPDGIPTKYEEVLLGVEKAPGAHHVQQELVVVRRRFLAHFKEFDEKVWRHYVVNAQNDTIYDAKMEIRAFLLNCVQRVFPANNVMIYAVGSTINGCGSYNSDMDLCLCIGPPGKQLNQKQLISERSYAIKTLRKVLAEFRKNRNMIPLSNLISAVVPILKLETVYNPPGMPEPLNLEVDMNVNNVAGIYNSHLVHYYSRIDDRFPALALLVKHWAINAGISDAMTGTFNSYSLILLVLHFLQCGVVPAVLPNLQYLYPLKFADTPNIFELNLFQELSPPLPLRPPNQQSVGELLVGFFIYYDTFDFAKYAISIRRGKIFERRHLPPEESKYQLYIEEPFDGKNTARCVQRANRMGEIRRAFSYARKVLTDSPPDLNSIKVLI